MVGLESRLKYIYKELSCTQFGHRESLQKAPAKERAAQRERSAPGEIFQYKFTLARRTWEARCTGLKGLKLCQIASSFL